MDKTLDQLAQDPTSSRFMRKVIELAQGRDPADVANDLHVLAIAAHKTAVSVLAIDLAGRMAILDKEPS